MSEHKLEHNFVKISHEKTPLGWQAWRCANCDTIRAFPSSYDQRLVNRIMANKLLCLSPLGPTIN